MSNAGQRLKSAVIGTGKISEQHLKFLSTNDMAELSSVCDLSPSLARYATMKFGAKAAYSDYQQMLAEVKPHVVHVLTPASSHVKLVTACLNANAHVIVEKPIALNRGDFLQLWHLSEQRSLHLFEDHNYRYNQPILAMEQLTRDGTLGEVRDIEIRMHLGIRAEGSRHLDRSLPHPSHLLPAGAIHEYISHFAYLALRWLPRIDMVKAAWRKHGTDTAFKYDDLDATIIGGQVHCRIRFSSDTYPDCFIVRVHGSKGSVETDLFQPHLRLTIPRKGGKQLSPLVNLWQAGKTLKKAARINLVNKIMQKTPYEGLATFLDKAYSCIRNGSIAPVTFQDMDDTIALIDAMLEEANRV